MTFTVTDLLVAGATASILTFLAGEALGYRVGRKAQAQVGLDANAVLVAGAAPAVRYLIAALMRSYDLTRVEISEADLVAASTDRVLPYRRNDGGGLAFARMAPTPPGAYAVGEFPARVIVTTPEAAEAARLLLDQQWLGSDEAGLLVHQFLTDLERGLGRSLTAQGGPIR